ncbi:MAG: hypothetical protein ACI9D4_002537 [Polaribacter sp.]|jgi:hypothetical protein
MVIAFFSFISYAQSAPKQNSCFLYSAKVENLTDDKAHFIRPASFVSFDFKGAFCTVSL